MVQHLTSITMGIMKTYYKDLMVTLILSHPKSSKILCTLKLIALMLFSRVTDLECAIFRYPGWKKVINKMPSLVDMRESLSSLANACHDVGSDKVCVYKNCITRPRAP